MSQSPGARQQTRRGCPVTGWGGNRRVRSDEVSLQPDFPVIAAVEGAMTEGKGLVVGRNGGEVGNLLVIFGQDDAGGIGRIWQMDGEE